MIKMMTIDGDNEMGYKKGYGIGEKTLVDTSLVVGWNIKEKTEKRKKMNRKDGKRLMKNKGIWTEYKSWQKMEIDRNQTSITKKFVGREKKLIQNIVWCFCFQPLPKVRKKPGEIFDEMMRKRIFEKEFRKKLEEKCRKIYGKGVKNMFRIAIQNQNKTKHREK